MLSRGLRASFTASLCLLIAACSGGGGGGKNNGGGGGGAQPQPQTIAFVQGGPLNVVLDSTTTNLASGGPGTGAISYASANTSVVRVDPTLGTAAAVGLGSTTITATKAADANYLQAQATYTINVQTADRISAWIGANDTIVSLPQSANGKQFARARIEDCTVGQAVVECTSAAVSPAGAVAVTDTRATLTTPAHYAVLNGSTLGVPITVSQQRFAERILHGAVRFNGKYWVIGGGVPQLPRSPGAPTTTFVTQSDVWSSEDGKSWKLETANAAFGRRWVHQTLVFDNKIWVLGGAGPVASEDVWYSSDGVTWTPVINNAQFGPIFATVAATVFNGEMWFVRNGTAYASSDGASWTSRSSNLVGGTTLGRGYATLTVHGGQLWYLGGAINFAPGSGGNPGTGDATNDVWTSSDGETWTQVAATSPFSARYQHASFVLNNELWVFGGRGYSSGVDGPGSASAYSTTNGITWTPRATATEADRSFLAAVVQEPGRVSLTGGVIRSFSNRVLQSTSGETWAEQLPLTFSPYLLSGAVSFNGYLWQIGGGRMDIADTNHIWRSADGINWQQVTTNGTIFSPRDSLRAVVFNNRMWVIGGWDYFNTEGGTQTYNNEVWSSADGVTWEQHRDPGFPPRAAHEAVVFNGRLWVIGGSNTSALNDVWSTADGQTWTRELEQAPFAERFGHKVLVLNNQMYLLGGGTGAPPRSGTDEVWRSADGRNWTLLGGSHFTPRMEHGATVFGNRMYVIGGASTADTNYATHYNDIWSSSDGITWQQDMQAAPFAPRKVHAAFTHGTELYVIGGYSVGRYNDVWRSSNGIDWRVAHSQAIVSP